MSFQGTISLAWRRVDEAIASRSRLLAGPKRTTKISTTCTVLSRNFDRVRTLRSSRTIEYYVLLSLCTIEKRKDRRKHADSIKCTATLTDLICAGEPCLPSGSTVDPDRAAKAAVRISVS